MGQALHIAKCDLQAPANNGVHRTAAISTERLVVRRGQPFAITLRFAAEVQNYLQQLKRVSLVVQTGPRPSKADGTHVQFPVSSLGDRSGWSAAVQERDSLSWSLSVTSPASAAVGRYTLLLRIRGTQRATEHPLGTFTLLFNPWCRDDSVFLPNEAQRQECVLNQDGSIYWGTESTIQVQPWDFSQFEEDIVDICFKLLDVGAHWQQDTDRSKRGDPVHVCRLVGAMLNCNELRRVLTGGWTAECRDGTPPTQWLGSAPILRQWAAERCQPVRYGQCWVFAAVACSVLRCLGIPTRVVTSFTWAHNTGGHLSVDEYYSESGDKVACNGKASIWSFHAWNECWMARPDLPPGYDGWQVLDATPQEKSGGPSSCGPTPVRAIRDGILELDPDVAPLFAALNAEHRVWVQRPDGRFQRAASGARYLGNSISTKAMSCDRCQDLTHLYKFPEGSPQAREVLERVHKKTNELEGASGRETDPNTLLPAIKDLALLLFVCIQPESSVLLGQDIQLAVTAANWSGGERAVYLVLGVQTLRYDGTPITQLWKEELQFTLRDNEEKTLSAQVPYLQYKSALGDGHLMLSALLKDVDTLSVHFAQEEISICKPQLAIKLPQSVMQYQPTTAEISLQNPLPEPLEQCVLSVTGRGLIYRERIYRCDTVQPSSSLHVPIPFTPTQAGTKRLTVHLSCTQIQDIKGYRSVNIVAAQPPA
ncbi:protein 4.2 [Alligator mississippiensis]|uniref:Erythrocyte membrane protein band 4.2 n=1 Tax=Alligator mississippiensis TaxID=8496 RepID=A0A151MUT7_ALLMI|nr:protein 4.2 [Alligator mississippiensis]KYO28280.1 erythrocyte membrane protein band 4.2 [Alligator mississippiensis]